MNINIIKEINRILVDKGKNSKRDYSYFHPSEWDGCHRKKGYLYYLSQNCLKVEMEAKKIDPVLMRIFDNGHKVHDRYREYLEATGALRGRWMCKNFSAHPEPRVYGKEEKLGIFRPEKCDCGSDQFEYMEVGLSDPESWWSGHVDAIIDLEKWPGAIVDLSVPPSQLPPEESKILVSVAEFEEKHIVVDFKSMSPFVFKDLKEPKPEHFAQMQIYLFLAGLKYGKFLYENKGNQTTKEFLVVRDDEYLKVQHAEAVSLKYQLTTRNENGKRVLPDRRYSKPGNQECIDCQFRGHCWKNWKE